MIKSILTAAAALAFSAAASAGGAFEADFTYNPAESIETTYASFQSQAKRACTVDLRKAGSIAAKSKMERACEGSLIDSAVIATENVALMALHTGDEPATDAQVFASAR